MQTRDTILTQMGGLSRGVFDTVLFDLFGSVFQTVDLFREGIGDPGTAQRGDPPDLLCVQNREDPGKDGDPDPHVLGEIPEAIKIFVVEEKLGDDEMCPCIDLASEVFHVLFQGRCFYMLLRITGNADTECLPFGDPRDQITGMTEPTPGLNEPLLAGWRVASQGEDVFDAPVGQGVQDLSDVVSGGLDAGQVGQGNDPELVVDLGGNLDGFVSRGPAGTVSDGNKEGIYFSKLIDGLIKGIDIPIAHWRKYLKGQGKAALVQMVANSHHSTVLHFFWAENVICRAKSQPIIANPVEMSGKL